MYPFRLLFIILFSLHSVYSSAYLVTIIYLLFGRHRWPENIQYARLPELGTEGLGADWYGSWRVLAAGSSRATGMFFGDIFVIVCFIAQHLISRRLHYIFIHLLIAVYSTPSYTFNGRLLYINNDSYCLYTTFQQDLIRSIAISRSMCLILITW
jgi:hypothetical protein